MQKTHLFVAGSAVRVGAVLDRGGLWDAGIGGLLEQQIPSLRCGMTARKARAAAKANAATSAKATTGVLHCVQDDGARWVAQSLAEAIGSGGANSGGAVRA
jgi:hypothetical protein